MPLIDSELELLEKKYFDIIHYVLKSNLDEIERRLKSGYYVKEDWKSKLKKESVIDIGAERVLRAVLFDVIQWKVNSMPIGSDMVFEVDSEAMIHIDGKTVKIGDVYGDDEPGTLLASPNQASYPGFTIIREDDEDKVVPFKPNLPRYYNHSRKGEMPCLTYFIKLVYSVTDLELGFERASVYCLPNGQLSYYDNLVKGVKTYVLSDGEKVACGSTRFDANKMKKISQKEADWERMIGKVEF